MALLNCSKVLHRIILITARSEIDAYKKKNDKVASKTEAQAKIHPKIYSKKAKA
jgi:hypothetical protein